MRRVGTATTTKDTGTGTGNKAVNPVSLSSSRLSSPTNAARRTNTICVRNNNNNEIITRKTKKKYKKKIINKNPITLEGKKEQTAAHSRGERQSGSGDNIKCYIPG